MWYNRDLVVFLEYNIFSCSARCIRIWSAQRFFFVFVVTIYCFSHVHKFFRVSGLGILARARGNFMHNNILRHTFTQFAIRWAGM
jgi:hypothetical protein